MTCRSAINKHTEVVREILTFYSSFTKGDIHFLQRKYYLRGIQEIFRVQMSGYVVHIRSIRRISGFTGVSESS